MIKFLIPFLIISSAQAEPLEMIYKNNRAVGDFKKEKKIEAYEQFLSLLAIDPFNFTVQFNLGSTLSGVAEEAKALALYKDLLTKVDEILPKTTDKDEQQKLLRIKFALLYNLGVSYQSTQDIDPALENYQKALELLPDSQEIKTNIELMFSGGKGGKGKSKDKDKGEGKSGEGEPSEGSEGDDQKNQDRQQPSEGKEPKEGQGKQGKEFDQKQMSMENLKQIMDELKQQEQNIRAKVQRKGGKSEPKEKQW